ncbi:MAG: heavy metal-associated domain-containing protein, partial [Planctomycetota bacterium]|nr:heavy metal-associated domain-containing protein [Planctomycetota bacterium]
MSEPSSHAAVLSRDLPVEGMHCAGCVQSVETLLRATDGVGDAQVNFGTQRARIEGTATLATLEARLAKGGYRLGDRSTQLPAGIEADAVRAVDGVLEVEATAEGLAVRHVDERHVLAALRALLPEGAALETEADPRARRLDRAERSWRLRFVLAAAIAVFLMVASMTA